MFTACCHSLQFIFTAFSFPPVFHFMRFSPSALSFHCVFHALRLHLPAFSFPCLPITYILTLALWFPLFFIPCIFLSLHFPFPAFPFPRIFFFLFRAFSFPCVLRVPSLLACPFNFERGSNHTKAQS